MSKLKHTKSFCWLEDNSSKSLLLNFTDSAVDSQNEYNVLIILGIYVTPVQRQEADFILFIQMTIFTEMCESRQQISCLLHMRLGW